jgi:hypothetical protein
MIRKASIILVSFMLTFGFVASAQDETPAPEPTAEVTPDFTPTPAPPVEPPDDPGDPVDEEPVTPPVDLLQKLVNLLSDATYIVWAAAGVVILTGLIKVVAAQVGINITGAGAAFLALAIQVLIWLGYSIATYFSQGESFKSLYLTIIDIVRAMLPLFGAVGLGHEFYQLAHRRGWPVLGFKAPHPAKVNKYPPAAEMKSAGEGKDWAAPPR